VKDFREVAAVAAGPNATVFEHGWQSWSPTGRYSLRQRSPRAASPAAQIMGYRPELPAPDVGFQGEGLLALDPGDGGAVRLWSAPDPTREVPSIRLAAVGSTVVVSANGDLRDDVYYGGVEQALAQWADELAARLGVQPVASLPPLWCTWYYYFTHVTAADVLENLVAIDRQSLDVGVVQIDDGYQAGLGDSLERSSRFPHPLEDLASRIRDSGRRAGIWTAPLLVGERSQLARDHPDWLVGNADAGFNWEQRLYSLDVTHPDAAAYLQQVFQRLASWGFDFFKIDFLYAGALPGSRHQLIDPIPAYRTALQLIRKAVGGQATLLGCGAPLLPSIGLVDAMRISPDVAPYVEPPDGDLSKPAQRSAVLAGQARAFQHGRWWVNDPDCLIARPEVENRAAWAAHIERSGGLRGSSDRLDALDAWGVETTCRLLQPSSPAPDISGSKEAP
jgi:alpha-galactosidase